METPPFGITREEVLDLAARKLADAYGDDGEMADKAARMIRDRIEELFKAGLKDRVNEFLDTEMKKLVGMEIVPVNVWGEREGQPTTIRAELAKRARDFWNVRVEKDGRESHYGGTERSKVLMGEILKDEFAKAVKENADVIVSEFKAALKADAVKLVTDHIDKLINTRPR
jgi:hypothetical protein